MEGTVITDQVMAGGVTAIIATVMGGVPQSPMIENQVLKTSSRASTNVATEEFKKTLLAKAAIAREKNSKGKGQGDNGMAGKQDGQESAKGAKGSGHEMGHDHRPLATSSISERDAILRLLAS